MENYVDDKFFYAFVGLTVWMGMLGLVWPVVIILGRLREWQNGRNRR